MARLSSSGSTARLRRADDDPAATLGARSARLPRHTGQLWEAPSSTQSSRQGRQKP